MELQQLILEAWENRELLKDSKYSDAVREVIEEIDKGRLRVASPKYDRTEWDISAGLASKSMGKTSYSFILWHSENGNLFPASI